MKALIPVFDAHVDSLQRALDLDHDLGTRTGGHLDLVRGRAGGLTSVVLVCFVDPVFLSETTGGPAARANALLDEAHKLEARHPDQIKLVGNGEELRSAHSKQLIAGIPGIEGGHAIEERIELLQAFFERGLRVMTLVWNNHLSWIRSCQTGAGPEVPKGLSAFGRDVVREMNRLGMLIDVSHAGEQSFYDVLETTTRPVIASHSGCRALHDHQRNLDDEQLRALSANGGVIGIVFHPGFLDADARAEEVRLRDSDEYRAIEGRNDSEKFLR
ncbi:MAG: membrane dipeptidase, partial [Planctomycetota bacterium]